MCSVLRINVTVLKIKLNLRASKERERGKQIVHGFQISKDVMQIYDAVRGIIHPKLTSLIFFNISDVTKAYDNMTTDSTEMDIKE